MNEQEIQDAKDYVDNIKEQSQNKTIKKEKDEEKIVQEKREKAIQEGKSDKGKEILKKKPEITKETKPTQKELPKEKVTPPEEVVKLLKTKEYAKKNTQVRKEITEERKKQEEQLGDMPGKPEKESKKEIVFSSPQLGRDVVGTIIAEENNKYKIETKDGTIVRLKTDDKSIVSDPKQIKEIKEKVEISKIEFEEAETLNDIDRLETRGSITKEEAANKRQQIKDVAKDKLAKGFDGLATKLGTVKKLTPEEKTGLWEDVSNIAQGLYELGVANAQDLISKLKQEVSNKIKDQEKYKVVASLIKEKEQELVTKYTKERPRRFAQRFEKTEGISNDIKEGLTFEGKYYIPKSNKITKEEAEAIIREKGIDEATKDVVNTSNNIHPRVRVSLAFSLLEEYNRRIKAEKDPVAKKKMSDDAIGVFNSINEFGTTMGQGVQAYSMFSQLDPFTMKEKFKKDINKELTEEQDKVLDGLLDKFDKATEGRKKFEALEKIERYKLKVGGVPTNDILMSIWYANILSGYGTHLRNMIANISNAAGELSASSIRNPRDASRLFKALFSGYSKGLSEAFYIFKEGNQPVKNVKLSDYLSGKPSVLEVVDFKGGRFNPFNYLKYVQRLMVAADAFAFQGLKQMRANEIAALSGRTQGLKGKELDNYINEMLGQTSEYYNKALQQAESEGLTGIDAKVRSHEIIEQQRPDYVEYEIKNPFTGKKIKIEHNLEAEISDFAAYGTFNHKPEGRLGLMTDYVGKATDKFTIGSVKPLKFFVPFTRIVSNVANSYLNYSPYGFVRAFKGKTGSDKSPGYYKEYNAEEKAKLYIKASMGTMAAVSLYLMSVSDDEENEDFQITSDGTGDTRKNYELMETGWRPYSVRVGDKWISYKNTPFAIPFSTVGKLSDIEIYGGRKMDDNTFIKNLEISMVNTINYFTDMTFLSGLSTLFEIMGDKSVDSMHNKAKRFINNSAKSFIVPNFYTQLARQVENLGDIPIQEADGIFANILRDTPIPYNGKKPMINSLGEQVIPKTTLYKKYQAVDPVWQLIVDKRAWIGKPSMSTEIYDKKEKQSRTLTEEEYYKFAKERGSIIKKQLELNLEKLNKMSEDQVQDYIRILKSNATKQAKIIFYK
jgi:hypothetical protein